MKRVKLLLFVICGFILFIGTAKAEEPFLLDWQTAKETDILITNHVPFKDGYVVYSISLSESKVTYYDKTGKEIKSISSNNRIFLVKADGDYLFFGVHTPSDEILIEKYDASLSKVKEIVLYDSSSDFYGFGPYSIDEYVSVTDSIAIYEGREGKITVIDKELKNKTNVRGTKANIKKYFPKQYELIDFWEEVDPDSEDRPLIAKKNNQYVYTSNEYLCQDDSNIPSNNTTNEEKCYKSYITLLDKDYNELWEKEFEDYEYFNAVEFVDNYIVVAGLRNDKPKGDLLVLDLNGKVVQTITDESFYDNLEITPKGFMVTETTCPSIMGRVYMEPLNGGGAVSPGSDMLRNKALDKGSSVLPAAYTCDANHQVYYLLHKIETKVSGKGKIEVIGKQKAGEPVTFKITPEKGYVLSKVIVTDADGNKITFKDYVFTMPSADVTIEAVFVKESKSIINPDTGVLPTLIVTGAVLISFGLLLFFNKKYQFLK